MNRLPRLFPDQDILNEVMDVAEPISEAMKQLPHRYTDGFALYVVAATSIYIASHLVSEPKTPAEIARGLFRVAESSGLIWSLYTNLWDVRQELTDKAEIEVEDMDTWPPFSSDSPSDDDEITS